MCSDVFGTVCPRTPRTRKPPPRRSILLIRAGGGGQKDQDLIPFLGLRGSSGAASESRHDFSFSTESCARSFDSIKILSPAVRRFPLAATPTFPTVPYTTVVFCVTGAHYEKVARGAGRRR